MKNIICALLFVIAFVLFAETARAAGGFGDFTGGIIIIRDARTIRIQRIQGYSFKDIIISSPKARVTDARWSGDKLIVQLLNTQGRPETRIYSSFNSFSTK